MCAVTNICAERHIKCCTVSYWHHVRMHSSSFIQPLPLHYPDKKQHWYSFISKCKLILFSSLTSFLACKEQLRLHVKNVVDSLGCTSWFHIILTIVMTCTHCRITAHADHTKSRFELLISPEVMGRVGEVRGFLHEIPSSVGVWIYSWTAQTKLTFIELT